MFAWYAPHTTHGTVCRVRTNVEYIFTFRFSVLAKCHCTPFITPFGSDGERMQETHPVTMHSNADRSLVLQIYACNSFVLLHISLHICMDQYPLRSAHTSYLRVTVFVFRYKYYCFVRSMHRRAVRRSNDFVVTPTIKYTYTEQTHFFKNIFWAMGIEPKIIKSGKINRLTKTTNNEAA